MIDSLSTGCIGYEHAEHVIIVGEWYSQAEPSWLLISTSRNPTNYSCINLMSERAYFFVPREHLLEMQYKVFPLSKRLVILEKLDLNLLMLELQEEIK